MEINVKKASESNRNDIALCIAEGFEKDFNVLCKDTKKVANAISSGIQTEKFYVAEADNKIVGVLAISDKNGRAVLTDKSAYIKEFGFLKGNLAKLVLKEEFEQPLDYPETTGYLEFVAVRNDYKRKGVATAMIKSSMILAGYNEYVLDVTDVNESAIKLYTKIGFKEFKRIKEKHGKQKGFNEKIYMKYLNF